MHDTPYRPLAILVLRVVLCIMAVLLLWSAILIAVLVGGGVGIGSGVIRSVPALLCAGCAYYLPRSGRKGFWLTLVLLALVAFTQMARVIQADALGLVGLGITVAAIVLLLLPSSRSYLRARPHSL